jgi:hypothetical protein
LSWNVNTYGEEIELGPNDDDDDDNRPVFAAFFQRMRDIEAELDLMEARRA